MKIYLLNFYLNLFLVMKLDSNISRLCPIQWEKKTQNPNKKKPVISHALFSQEK